MYPLLLAEPPEPYFVPTERLIQAIWHEQQYFYPLTTTADETVEVVSPGIWNPGAGPDFLKSELKIGGELERGDVEIHLSEEDWIAHHHQHDVAYNDVILHLVLFPSAGRKPAKTASGKEIPTSFLLPKLTYSLSRLHQMIDTELYPYPKAQKEGRCAKGVFLRLPEDEANRVFLDAALWRLEKKELRLRYVLRQPQHQCGAGIAMALGYRHNAGPFLSLFKLGLHHTKMPGDNLFSLLLNAAGFFREKWQKAWGTSAYYQKLLALRPVNQDPEEDFSLRLSGIRPLNHPVRRLFTMSRLLTDPSLEFMEQRLVAAWRDYRHLAGSRELRDFLLECVPNYEDPFWNFHYTFKSHASSVLLPLVGDSLRLEILLNTLLPLLYRGIKGRQDKEEALQLQRFYQSLPVSDTSKGHYLQQRLLGASSDRSFKKSYQLQGAYQIHQDFCLAHETSCRGCPFVERFWGCTSEGS